jgi:hypothetical protein
MIQDEKTAACTLELIDRAHKLLMDSLAVVKTNCSEQEYKEYQAGMAHVLGRLFFLVMEPIYRVHPSLAPPDTPREFSDAWNRPKSGTD